MIRPLFFLLLVCAGCAGSTGTTRDGASPTKVDEAQGEDAAIRAARIAVKLANGSATAAERAEYERFLKTGK